MRTPRLSITAVAIILTVAACGGDTATDTTAPTTTASTAVTTTAAPATTTAETVTTTTTTTTTLPVDAHPAFGLSWADAWPIEGLSATYLVTLFSGEQLELPSRMEYGVEFADGVYDRWVVGVPEPGNHGMAVYFDRSEPWDIRVIGEESFSPDRTDRADSVYVFETPMSFSGVTEVGETQATEGRLSLTISTGDVFDMGVTYEVTLRGLESVTVGARTFDDVLAVDALVGGELLGGDFTFPVEIMLHADQFVVSFVGASGFDALELATPWG